MPVKIMKVLLMIAELTLLPFTHVSAVPQYSNFSGPCLPTSHGALLYLPYPATIACPWSLKLSSSGRQIRGYKFFLEDEP